MTSHCKFLGRDFPGLRDTYVVATVSECSVRRDPCVASGAEVQYVD